MKTSKVKFAKDVFSALYKEFFKDKATRNKIFKELFLSFYIGFLRLAVSLSIMSLFPLLLPVFLPSAFPPLRAAKLAIYFGLIFITISTSLLIIKKRGKKYFFRELFLYNLYYSGTSGKYYKAFVISMILFAVFSIISLFIGEPSYVKFGIVSGLAVFLGFYISKPWAKK